MTRRSFTLKPHPDTRPDAAVRITATVRRTATALHIRYLVDGSELIRWPPPGDGVRRDGLWRTTCFEAFLRPHGAPAYVEVNAAPSTDWAAYAFDDYRAGMRDAAVEVAVAGDDDAAWDVRVDLSALPELATAALDLSLTAVMEGVDGEISYFALRHGAGKPDFHHADCFAARLEAPDPA